jgi:hypothetical protein
MPKLAALLALATALLAGCATPDLQPFADETARLAGAVAEEQRQIALQFERVIELNEQACGKEKAAARLPDPPEPPKTSACAVKEQREKDAEGYGESRRIIDGVLDKAVGYASSLAQLAAAGETGGQAAQSLLTSVREFGSLVGVGGAAITPAIADTLGKISTAVTRVQAQRSLAEATKTAQEPINVVADGVREMHAPSDRIAQVLYNDEQVLLLKLAGPDLIGLFQDAALNREAMIARRLRAPVIADLLGCRGERCKDLQGALSNADQLGRLLEQLRPGYEAYETSRAALGRWRADRKANLGAIARAMDAWKAEHARVAQALERCGGLNAVRCARIDAASLRKAVDRINEIRMLRSR